ncbi:hypothetical protein [Limnoglobus roseus]|uniref:Uncharacterized protein n=1 Tax=Limnoglobus roseus TaxID=2598579 RepID=A0A5C1AKB3_9BACT|nr:hypothetical protein [Limnoglobus roseus]QEL19829.1 hypothetical protein PX52LOC_06910 [Limnoglobus roseus]
MQLDYGDLKGMEVFSNSITVQPVWDDGGTHVLYHRWHLNLDLHVSPDAISYTHDPRGDDVPVFDVWGRPINVIQAIKPQGRASAILTMNSIRGALLEPRQRLRLWEYSKLDSGEGVVVNPGSQNPRINPVTERSVEVLVEAPLKDHPLDSRHGPNPISVDVRQVVGLGQTFVVNYQVEAHTPVHGYSLGSADDLLLSNSYTTTSALTSSYACIRRTEGVACFRIEALTKLNIQADSYRSYLFPRCAIGWQRKDLVVTLGEDGATITYSFNDVQAPMMSVQDEGAGVAEVTLNYDEALTRDSDAIEAIIDSYQTVYSLRSAKAFATPHPTKGDDSQAQLAAAIAGLTRHLAAQGAAPKGNQP